MSGQTATQAGEPAYGRVGVFPPRAWGRGDKMWGVFVAEALPVVDSPAGYHRRLARRTERREHGTTLGWFHFERPTEPFHRHDAE